MPCVCYQFRKIHRVTIMIDWRGVGRLRMFVIGRRMTVTVFGFVSVRMAGVWRNPQQMKMRNLRVPRRFVLAVRMADRNHLPQ